MGTRQAIVGMTWSFMPITSVRISIKELYTVHSYGTLCAMQYAQYFARSLVKPRPQHRHTISLSLVSHDGMAGRTRSHLAWAVNRRLTKVGDRK